MCPSLNLSLPALNTSCQLLEVVPFNYSNPARDAVAFAGSYNIPLPFSRRFNVDNMAEVVFIEADTSPPPAGSVGPPPLIILSIRSRAALCSNCTPPNATGNLGVGSTNRDLSAIYGNYAGEQTSFVLCLSQSRVCRLCSVHHVCCGFFACSSVCLFAADVGAPALSVHSAFVERTHHHSGHFYHLVHVTVGHFRQF